MAVTEKLIVEAEFNTSSFNRSAKTVVGNIEDINDATEESTKSNKDFGASYEIIQKKLSELTSVLKTIEASFKKNTSVVVGAAKSQTESNKEIIRTTEMVANEISKTESIFRSINSAVSVFTASMNILANAFNFLDDLLGGRILPDFQKLFLILSDLAEWTGFENTSQFFNDLASDTGKLNERLMELNKGYDLAVKSNDELNKSVSVTVNKSGLDRFIDLINLLTKSFLWLSDENNLRNLSAFFRLIATGLGFKGNDELSARFILLADSTDKAISTLKLFNKVKNAVFGQKETPSLTAGEDQTDSTVMEGLLKKAESAKSKLADFENAAKLAAGGVVVWFGTKFVRAFMPGFAQVVEENIDKVGGMRAAFEKLSSIYSAQFTSIRGFINNIEDLGRSINAFGISLSRLDKDRLSTIFKFISKGMLVTAGAVEILAEKVQYLSWLFELKTETLRKYLAGLGVLSPTLKSAFNVLNDFNDYLINGAQRLRTLSENMVKGSVLVEKFGQQFIKAIPNIKSLGVFISDFSTVVTGLGKDIQRIPAIFKILVENSTPALGRLGSFITMTAGTSAGLASMGMALLQLDSTMAKVAGGSMIALAISIGGITYAIQAATTVIGDFIANVGFYFFDFFDSGIDIAAKQELALFKYNATLQRISVNVQKNSSSLKNWESILSDITGSYQVSTIEAQNYILSIIKLGQELQLSQQDQEQLALSMSRFATSQEELTEISNATLEALRGEGKAAERLGINLNDAAIDSSDYAVSIGKISSSMTKNEKVQAKLNLLFAQSIAAQQSLAASGDTLIKVQNKVKVAEEELQAQWSAGDLTLYRYANTIKLVYLEALLAIPQPVKEAVADITALTGAFLIGAGTIMKWSLTVSASIGLVATLNKLLQTSATLQALLTIGFKNVNGVLKTQSIAVTDLKSVFLNLGHSIKGVAAAIGATLLVSLKKAYQAFITFSAAVLGNPLFWKAAIIIGAIYLVGKALQRVNDETSFFARITTPIVVKLNDLKKSFKENSDILTRLADGFSAVIETLIDLSVVLTTTILRAVIVVMAGWMKLYELIGNDEQAEKARKAIRNMKKDFEDLDKVREKSLISLAQSLDGNAAYAAGADKTSDAMRRQRDEAERTQKQIRAMADALLVNFNKELESIKTLGTDYEKLNARKKQLELQTNNLAKSTKDAADQAQELADIEKEMYQVQLDMMKLRQDSVTKVQDEINSLRLDELKRNGQTLKAIDIEANAKIKKLEDERKGLESIRQLKLEDHLLFNEQIKLTKEAAQAAKTQEIIKSQETINDLKKNLTDIQKEINAETQGEISAVIQRTAERAKELDLETQRLRLQGSLTKEAKEILRLTKEANQEAAKAKIDKVRLDTAKELNKTNADLEKQLIGLTGLEQEIIDAQLKSELAIIAAKKEQLYLENAITKMGPPSAKEQEILKALQKEQQIREKIAGIQKGKAASTEFDSAKRAGTNVAEGITKAFQSGTAGAVMGAMTGVGAVADAIQALIDFIPGILDKVSNVFNSLTELPNKIVAGLANVFDSILKFVSDFIPNLLKMIPAIFEKFTSFFEKLPDVFANLLTNLPDMLTGLLDRLPDLVENFVQKFIEAIPKIAVSLINFLIKDGPRLAIAIAKALTIEIPLAIVKGILDAIKSLPKIFSQLGKGILPKPAEIAKTFALGIKAAAKTLTGVASKLFAVMDLEDGAKSNADRLSDFAKTADRAIGEGVEKIRKGSEDLWKGLVDAWRWVYDNIILPIFNGIRAVWLWVYDKVITPIVEAIRGVWLFVYDKVIMPLVMGIREVWLFVYDKVIMPIIDGLRAVWLFVYEKVVLPLVDGIKAVWEFVNENIIKPLVAGLGAVWAKAKELLDPIVQAFKDAFEGIKTTLENIIQGLKDAFNAGISGLKDAGEKIKEKVEAAATALKDALGAVGDLGGRIWNGFKDQIDRWDFGAIGGKIWNGLKGGLDQIGGLISNQLNGINPANIFSKIFSLPGDAFGNRGPVEKQLKFDMPFMEFAKGGMVPGKGGVPNDSRINDRIVALLSAGEAIIPKSKMDDPAVAGIVQGILSGKIGAPAYALGGVVGGLKKMGGDLAGAFQETIAPVADILDPAKILEQAWASMKGMVWDKVLDMFWEMLSRNKFHDGGLVPGSGEMPSMLKGGEFVLNKSAASSIGVPTLNDLNAGKAPSNNTQNIELNLVINTTQPIDATMIKNKIMPVIREELKRASIDGRTTIYQSGVRTA